ncbi:acyl carrier protein [Streptosporangium sp. NPDC048865]|uniref:acyl carrier protein n=1 Tax=Streptosporangium sp. NPDC048865 TaxID=3155766 RepID=UPI00342B6BB2
MIHSSRPVGAERQREEAGGRPPGPPGHPGHPGQRVSAADTVAEMIEARLGRPVDPDENFFEAGLNSMALVELHADITGVLDIDIPAPGGTPPRSLRAPPGERPPPTATPPSRWSRPRPHPGAPGGR